MITVTLEQKVHTALVDLKNNIPASILGICFHLGNRLRDARVDYQEELAEAFEAWPKFSGSIQWPVPCPNAGSPMEAYANSCNMWNPEDAYGALRLELLDHMVQHFEAKL